MAIKTILTPSLGKFAEEIYYASLNGWVPLKDNPADMSGWQYFMEMYRPDDYSTEEREKVSPQESMAMARVTLKENRSNAKAAGLKYRDYMDTLDTDEAVEQPTC